MTPPIRPILGAVPPETVSQGPVSPIPSSAHKEAFRPQPLNSLRHEFGNPLRSDLPISNLGDIKSAWLETIQRTLPGARVAQWLGSWPGHLYPQTPLNQWDTDQKFDVNLIGDGEAIVRQLAPVMGWSERTMKANVERVRRGMVYFNLALETRAGPVPFKMGIIDEKVMYRGEPYFSLRASLLPERGSYQYLRTDPEHQTQFESWVRGNKGAYLEHAINSFLFRSVFTADQLAERRFSLQFSAYEGLYRGFFELTKGAKHMRRLANWIPEIMAPAVREYMETHRDLKAYSPGLPGVELRPQDVTEKNFRELSFTLQRSAWQRGKAFLGQMGDFFIRNLRMGRQTLRNIGSNGTSRPGYHQINWFEYGKRKFARIFGISGSEHPRSYTTEASFFPSEPARRGATDSPLRQMVILAGYDPGDENVPKVFDEIRRYAAAEIEKGALPNPLFRGIEPSKFTLPIRGVPSVAYQLMNGLESEGITHFVLAGTPDTKIVFDHFQEFYGPEIQARGKTFQFVPMGNSFTANLRKAIEALPYKDENVAMSMGDNPLIDVDRMVNHPERHISDWIVGPNSRTMLMHDGGKNYHVDGQGDGIHHPVKEGNAYVYPGDVARVPWDMLQAIFNSRKSMAEAGTKSKFRIIMDILFDPRRGRFLSMVDSVHFFFDLIGRSGWQDLQLLGGRKVPPAALHREFSERTLFSRLGVRASLNPNHSDAGGVLDIDGVGDLAIAKGLMEGTEHPEAIYPHWDKLAPFGDYLQEKAGDQLPALQGTPARLNKLYQRLYEAFLEMKVEPPGRLRRFVNAVTFRSSRVGQPRFTEEQLRARGFSPDTLPFLEDGQVNPVWRERILPERDFRFFRLGFEAYQRRAEHAKGLLDDFHLRVEATRPVPEGERVKPEIQAFAMSQLNVDPERSRSQLIEWNYDRITQSIINAGQKKYGVGSAQVGELTRYIEQSTTGNLDTPLRRAFTGLKAVDVLRRSDTHLSPEEFRSLFPYLAESIMEAQDASGGRLQSYFKFAQTTVDREYLRHVGESPPTYRERGLASWLPHSNDRDAVIRARARGETPGLLLRADSAPMRPADLSSLAYKLNIMPSRIPHLIAAASGADSPDRLMRIPASRMTPERLMAWVQSPDGQTYMEGRSSVFEDTFRNRFIEGAPGLGIGVASLFGAEYLATQLGLDARRYPHERFAFVVGLSHLTGNAGQAVSEVFLNRSLAQPFNFVTSRTVQSGSEFATQFSFEARPTLSRALFSSLSRNFLGAEGGIMRTLGTGLKGAATLPLRAAWGMGPGLMSSALIDRTIGASLFADSPRAREALKFGSFFLPDLYRMGWGNRGPAIFESAGMRWAGRAFAAGFILDMGFQGAQRLQHGGEGLGTVNAIYARANELHNADHGTMYGIFDGAIEMLSPSFANWVDSVEFNGLSLQPNRYQRQAREELQRFSLDTTTHSQDFLRHAMIYGTEGQALDPRFYTQVNTAYLEGANQLGPFTGPNGRELPIEQVFEQLNYPEIRQRIMVNGSREDQINYVRRQYRGHHLTRQDAEAVLDHITLYRLRQDIAGVQAFELSENADLRRVFDANGSLRPAAGGEFRNFVFHNAEVSDSEILRMRQTALAYRILELQANTAPSAAQDLAAYQGVAREVGLVDAAGNLLASPVVEEARTQFSAAQASLGHTGVPLTFDPPASPTTTTAPYMVASTLH